MKVTRNKIKQIRKDAKKALKKERRAVKRAMNRTYTAVDLDSEKTTARMLPILDAKLKAFRFPPLRPERLENDAEPAE